MAYLDSHGLETLWTKIKASFARKIANSTGDDSVVIKLQNASGSDLDSGSTTIAGASTTAAGVMSKTDKSKLDGIEAGANNYVHPSTSGNKHIPSGGSSGKILGWDDDGTAAWIDSPSGSNQTVSAGGSTFGANAVVEIKAGSNVSVTPDTLNNRIEVSAQDTTYESKTAASGGSDISLCTTGEKYSWNSKQDPITFNTAYNPSSNKAATMSDIATAVSGSAKYKGTLGTEAAFIALTNYKVGDYYVASASFSHTIGSSTITIDAGNMIFCNKDYASAYSANDFDIIQTDIEAIPDSVINALS